MAIKDNNQTDYFALIGNRGVRGTKGKNCYVYCLIYINILD